MKFATGTEAFVWDCEEAMKAAGIPQNIRVFHGLLDSTIGCVAMAAGAVQFQTV